MKRLNRIIIFIGYIPVFFAWLIPMYLFPKDEDIQFHAKQSFLLSVAFVLLYFLNMMIAYFPLLGDFYSKYYVYVGYLFYIIYVFLSFLSGFFVFFKEDGLRIPVIRIIAQRLPI